MLCAGLLIFVRSFFRRDEIIDHYCNRRDHVSWADNLYMSKGIHPQDGLDSLSLCGQFVHACTGDGSAEFFVS